VYYVDNIVGNDSNPGTSTTRPFATIARLNSVILLPGQTVAFRAGEEWHETLLVNHSGVADAPITYTSFGSGAQPIINAADYVSGSWTQGAGTDDHQQCSSPCIFSSGFETANFSDWTSTNIANPNLDGLTILAVNPAHGAGVMALSSSSGQDGRLWVSKTLPKVAKNSSLGIRFYLKTNGAWKPNASGVSLILCAAQGSEAFQVSINTDANGNPSAINAYDEVDSLNLIPYNTPLAGFVAGEWNEIEFDFTTSSTAGGGSVYLNGNLLSSYANVNTSRLEGVDSISLGNIVYGKMASGSTLYFDDVMIQNGSLPIGLFSGGVPTTIWSHAQVTDPKLININGQAGIPVASMGAILANNQYHWDGKNLYLYSLNNPASTVAVPQRAVALSSSGVSNIVVTGLEFRGAQTYDVYCGSTAACSNWDFEGDTFNSSYSNELYWQQNSGIASPGLIVHNSIFKGGGSSGIKLTNGGASAAQITGNQFYDLCKVYNTAYPENTWCDAVYGFSQTGTDQAGTYVAHNIIHDIGLGQTQQYGGGIHADTVTGWDIEYNTVTNTNMPGVQIEKGTGSTARYNLIVDAGTGLYLGGLSVRAGEGIGSSNQLVEMNTIYGGYWACNIAISQNAAEVTVTGLLFRKNICGGASSGTQFYADAGARGGGNSFMNNSFGVEQPNFIVFNNILVNTYRELDSAVGSVTGSIQGDPQFVNQNTDDFALRPSSPASKIGAFPEQ
jgi:hypothetical protein